MRFIITAQDVKDIAEMVDDGSFEEATFRTDYSGRGMYGDTCFGYVGSNIGAVSLELIAIIAKQNTDGLDTDEMWFADAMDALREASHDLGAPASDSMGTSIIHYWPNVSVEATDTDSDYQ